MYIYIWVVVKIMAPFLGTQDVRCRIIIGTQKGTIILTTTHIYVDIGVISGGFPLQHLAVQLRRFSRSLDQALASLVTCFLPS